MDGHVRRPVRGDTFDLRDQMQAGAGNRLHAAHADAAGGMMEDSEGEHSVLEDDSDEGEMQDDMDYLDEDDDDGSSSLSIPNESIDFDLVYSLHSFAATVEGQANVVKGDSLILMDDTNSYWWLVRVLKTQEVGYIPAENIETPFERLARLNKHRNVDLAKPTNLEEVAAIEREKARLGADYEKVYFGHPVPLGRKGAHPVPAATKSDRTIAFIPDQTVSRYPPFIWFPEEEEWDEEEDDEDEWDIEPYQRMDPGIEEDLQRQDAMRAQGMAPQPMQVDPRTGPPLAALGPDDGMAWDAGAIRQQGQQMAERMTSPPNAGIPAALQAGGRPPPSQQQAPPQQQQQVSPQKPDEAGPRRTIDPLNHGETLKLSPTPGIVRDAEQESSAILRSQQEEAMARQQQMQQKRRLEDEAAAANEAAKRQRLQQGQAPQQSSPQQQQQQQQPQGRPQPNGGKLTKSNKDSGSLRSSSSGEQLTDDESKKQKKPGLISSIFGSKKKKDKDRQSSISSSAEGGEGRVSSESGGGHGSGMESGLMSPTTGLAMQQQQKMAISQVQQQQQQQQQQQLLQQQRNSTDPKKLASMQEQQGQQPQSRPPQPASSGVLAADKRQQQMYMDYLASSPATSLDPALNIGLQTASALGKQYPSHGASSSSGGSFSSNLGVPDTKKQRPGSLILTPTSPDGIGVVPELSVIRVFAGSNLQTDATFKTVLLNQSTTAGELIKQAIQRFRLPQAELSDEASLNSYYLLAKQVEGGASLVLKPGERPLMVFEEMNKHANELDIPRVKRASVGSISSVASNLSMHPAIEKLNMNDFSDDSAVKFYLNRRGEENDDEDLNNDDEFMMLDGKEGSGRDEFGGVGDDTLIAEDDDEQPSSPYRPGDRLTVKTSGGAHVGPERFSSPGFRFPLQIAIYPEDLPDDMVFDPLTEAIIFRETLKERNSGSRTDSGVSQDMRKKVFVIPKNMTVGEVVEMGLERFGIVEGVVDGGDEVEDKATNPQRRSQVRVRYTLCVDIDGEEEELTPNSKVIDAYPHPPTYKAVDRKLQDNNKRRSVDSGMLLGSMDDVHEEDPLFVLRRAHGLKPHSAHRSKRNSILGAIDPDDSKLKILAQRKAHQDRQRAALGTAQSNSMRGVDVLMPGNVILRSSRKEPSSTPRYSMIEADGEEKDVSQLVEEQLREEGILPTVVGNAGGGANGSKVDLLQGLGQFKNGMASLEAVVNMMRNGGSGKAAKVKGKDGPLQEDDDDPRATTPQGQYATYRSNTTTPTGRTSRRQASDSDISVYATPTSQLPSSPLSEAGRNLSTTPQNNNNNGNGKKAVFLPKNDFGIPHMLSVIECRALQSKPPPPRIAKREIDHVDDLLFGKPLDSVDLHPDVKGIYGDAFKQLEEVDRYLDSYITNASVRTQ